MVAQPKRMTLDAFLALPDDGNRHEFVRGELRVMAPVGRRHGRVEEAITEEIGLYLRERAGALGWEPHQGLVARDRLVGFVAGGEFGMQFAVPDDPNQVRGADAAYVPPEQFARSSWDGDGYFPEVPYLVVEVISPSESAAEVNEKVQDYLTGGAHRVWCVYPERRTVHIHDGAAPTRVVRWGASVTDEELLPGFVMPLNLIFSEPR